MPQQCQVQKIAFQSFSILEYLLHPTAPEPSYTPSDAPKPNTHTSTKLRYTQSLVSVDVCWCLLVSVNVLRCPEVYQGCLKRLPEGI